jgi:acyl carrier protein
MELRTKIRSFINDNLIVADATADRTFADTDNIFKMGFVNSLFAMKLLNYVENEFDILIENEDISITNFSSVENIVRLVNSKKEMV